jgi:hypothetical protein
MTTVTFTFHSDPSHAWLQVETSMIRSLAVMGISEYSYIDGAAHLIAFLEEDQDAAVFMDAYQKANPRHEIKFKENHMDTDHWIRSLPRYNEQAIVLRDMINNPLSAYNVRAIVRNKGANAS